MNRMLFLLVVVFTLNTKAQVLSLVNKTNINCTNDLNGQATFSINGSSFPYSAMVTGCNTVTINGITTNTFTINGIGNCLPYMNISPSGQYTVSLKDNSSNVVAGLTFSMTSVYPYFLLQPNVYNNINCPDANNGFAQWVAVYGTGPFTFLWSTATNTNYASGPSISNVPPGTYSITATDNFGCRQTWSSTFTNPYMNIQVTPPTMPTCCNGTITYNVVGIIPPPVFSYYVNPSVTSNTTVCSGNYTIMANSGTCTATSTFSVGCATGINEVDFAAAITIFPNPAVSVLTIGSQPFGTEVNQIEIRNYLGKDVYIGKFSKSVDVSDFNPGCYFLILINKDGQRMFSKFIKE